MDTGGEGFEGPWAISRAELAKAGVTAGRLRSALARGELVRIRRGIYATAPLAPRRRHLLSGGRPDPAYLEQVRAALLALGGAAAAAGRTAAVLWGFDLVVEPALIEVHAARGRTHAAMAGVLLHARSLVDTEVRDLAGHRPVRVLTPVATVLDCAASRPLHEAVAVADSAMRLGAVTLDQLTEAVQVRRSQPGVRRLRRVLALVDPACESVLESLLRVLLAQHGIALGRSQYVIRTPGGQTIARADFAWPEFMLMLECDGGRWHDPDDARDRDRRRDNEAARLGWRVLRITWDDVVNRPAYVAALVHDALMVELAA